MADNSESRTDEGQPASDNGTVAYTPEESTAFTDAQNCFCEEYVESGEKATGSTPDSTSWEKSLEGIYKAITANSKDDNAYIIQKANKKNLGVIRALYEKKAKGHDCKQPLRIIGDLVRSLASRTIPNPYKKQKKTSCCSCYTKTEKPKDDKRKFVHRDLLLWAILHMEFGLVKQFFKEGSNHIGTALITSGIFYKYHLKALQNAEQDLADELARYSRYFEEIAVRLLTTAHGINPSLTYKLLGKALPEWSKGSEKNDCVVIAHHCKRQKFVSHSVVQKTLSKKWFGRLETTNPKWKIVFTIFFPFAVTTEMIKFNKEETDALKGKNYRVVRKMRAFYTAPITKFISHMMSYMLFILVFSYFVMVELRPLSDYCVQWVNSSQTAKTSTNGVGTCRDCLLHDCNGIRLKISCITPIEILVYFWLLGLFLEEIRQLIAINSDPITMKGLLRKFKVWIISDWNKIDFVLSFVFTTAICIRIALYCDTYFVHVRNAYALMLALYILRFIQFHFAHRYIGPKVLMVRKVMKEIIVFASIFVVFLLAYGTAVQSLLYPNYSLNSTLIKQVVYQPYWQVYGELNLQEVEGKNKDAMPVVLFAIYMLFCNVLLVNLLIAMFGFTFDNVQSYAYQLWAFNRCDLVDEYQEKPFMVPPFNWMNIVFRLILHCKRKRKKKNEIGEKNKKEPNSEEKENEEVTKHEKVCWKNFEKKWEGNEDELLDLFREEQETESLESGVARMHIKLNSLENSLNLICKNMGIKKE